MLDPSHKPIEYSTRMQAPLPNILDLELASSVLDHVLVSTSDTRGSAAGNLLACWGRGLFTFLGRTVLGFELIDGD